MRVISRYKRQEYHDFPKAKDPNCQECHGTGEVENTHIGGGDFLPCDCKSERRLVEVETIVREVKKRRK